MTEPLKTFGYHPSRAYGRDVANLDKVLHGVTVEIEYSYGGEVVGLRLIEPEYEWGYTHAERDTAIAPDNPFRNKWESSREQAEENMKNDLRWRPETYLVKRAAPGPMEVADEE